MKKNKVSKDSLIYAEYIHCIVLFALFVLNIFSIFGGDFLFYISGILYIIFLIYSRIKLKNSKIIRDIFNYSLIISILLIGSFIWFSNKIS